MFGKIKDRLKNVFAKSEELIEEEGDIIETEDNKKINVVVEKEFKKVDKKKTEKKVIKNDEKVIEKVEENIVDEEVIEVNKKKGFLSRVFGSSDDENVEDKEGEKVEEQLIEEEDDKSDKKKDEGMISKAFSKLKSKKLTQDDFERIWVELEIFLLEINIAYEIVQKIEEKLRNALIDSSFDRFTLSNKIREVMTDEVREVMTNREDDLLLKIKEINDKGEIAKILILGVNGTGKTTTIAKIVRLFDKNGFSLVVAASDTFRAAAVEQLDEHAKKVGFKLIKHEGGSDPAAVAYDAIEHAKAKKLDVVIIDTAGRMPNNSNLMQELAKIERVSKSDINIFVGDSVSGNDLMDQIELFDKIVGIDGMILTKTDTDERPGSVVTAAYSIEKPIYYLGIGQGYDDLVKFDAKLVASKLFEIE